MNVTVMRGLPAAYFKLSRLIGSHYDRSNATGEAAGIDILTTSLELLKQKYVQV